MTKLQLLLFAWVCAWVLAESISPNIDYWGQFYAACIATFATFFAHRLPSVIWTKLKSKGNKGV